MNDDRQRLGQLLDQLRAQLAASASVDADLRTRLVQTLDEAQQVLASPGGQSRPAEPIGQRLSEAAISFEVSHPTLAAEVSSIIDALGRMGI
jgi:Domain of unknown function (DUF4404)